LSFAYSTRYIADEIPSGTAINKEINVTSIVFTIAGNKDTFSELYSSSKRSNERLGIPLISIYPIRENKIAIVIKAAI
jgi:hypothetical protein